MSPKGARKRTHSAVTAGGGSGDGNINQPQDQASSSASPQTLPLGNPPTAQQDLPPPQSNQAWRPQVQLPPPGTFPIPQSNQASAGTSPAVGLPAAVALPQLTSQDESTQPPTKKARKQRRRKGDPEEDYSAKAREKASTAVRTGQACDRCKVRETPSPITPHGQVY